MLACPQSLQRQLMQAGGVLLLRLRSGQVSRDLASLRLKLRPARRSKYYQGGVYPVLDAGEGQVGAFFCTKKY